MSEAVNEQLRERGNESEGVELRHLLCCGFSSEKPLSDMHIRRRQEQANSISSLPLLLIVIIISPTSLHRKSLSGLSLSPTCIVHKDIKKKRR